jgi:hypothetical protein
VHDLLVDRDADLSGKFAVSEERAPATQLRHVLGRLEVNFTGGNPRRDKLGKTIEHDGGGASGGAHFLDLGG